MIEVTHLAGKIFWINPHQIDYIETTPDTTICMSNGNRIVVRENVESIIERIVTYRKRIGAFKNEE